MRKRNSPRLTPEELTQTSSITLKHYDEHAGSFWEGTRDHDVSQNRDALLEQLRGDGPFRILDFGCGPGRDLVAFRDMGHEAIGLEGAEKFVDFARQCSGCIVWHQDFLHLQLPPEYFDGIFANASLFHVPSQELPRVLKELWAALKPGGVLFSSNPRGENEEGWNGQRYGVYYNLERWRELVTAACFTEISHYYRPPGLPREQQPWLASLWRKTAG
jgi:SAM-dependent methyltransferase